MALNSTSKVITPYGLDFLTSTETRTGLIKTATELQMVAGTNDWTAVTPLKLKNYISSYINGHSISIGDDSALTHDILHNLGTTDLVVQVYENATNEEVLVGVKKISVNEVRISTNIPPMGLNEYRVVIKK